MIQIMITSSVIMLYSYIWFILNYHRGIIFIAGLFSLLHFKIDAGYCIFILGDSLCWFMFILCNGLKKEQQIQNGPEGAVVLHVQSSLLPAAVALFFLVFCFYFLHINMDAGSLCFHSKW